MSKRVLVVATSKKTRGGITAVISAHRTADFWNKWHCYWIETHIDKTVLFKIYYFIKSFITYSFLLPNAALVHCHLSGPISVKRKYPFLILAKILKKPIIIHFHAFSSDSTINPNFKGLYKKVFLLADKVIVLSNNWRKGLIDSKITEKHKIEVIYNPCTPINFSSKYKKQNFILYAGTLNKRKGYSNLIRAFSNISVSNPDWKLVFLGNGEIELAQKIVETLNCKDKVIFKGWVTGEEKHKSFSESSIFCLPSYAEGFPMAILDAWAYGLPVITTPVGGIPDIAVDCENMLLFNPNKTRELSEKLEILIKDSLLRGKLSKASLNFSKNKFSINVIGEQLNILYGNVIDKNIKEK